MDKRKCAPVPTVRRLPIYLEYLRGLPSKPEKTHVSCTQIADTLNLVPSQVRKDLSCTGIMGKPKKGYPIDLLIDAIKRYLGWDKLQDAFLLGAGALGTAIMGYEGFLHHGLRIVAAFDTDPQKVGAIIRKIKVFHADKLPSLAQRMNICLAVLTVPAIAAQNAADSLAKANIKAIWNFTAAQIDVPPGVIIENAHLASSFAVLSARFNTINKENAN